MSLYKQRAIADPGGKVWVERMDEIGHGLIGSRSQLMGVSGTSVTQIVHP